jgi:hypothetical protein
MNYTVKNIGVSVSNLDECLFLLSQLLQLNSFCSLTDKIRHHSKSYNLTSGILMLFTELSWSRRIKTKMADILQGFV